MATNKPVQTCASKETTDGSDCKKKKCFKLKVKNKLREPNFTKSVSMEIEDENSPLIEYMEKTVSEPNGLMTKFTVTYFSGGLGYFIEAINDAKATYAVDQSIWLIRSNLVPPEEVLGISSFIPQEGTEVELDLITGSRDDKKRFTFTVRNQLRKPFFDESVIMEIVHKNSPLIRYMEKAVDEKNGLMNKFTVTYDTDSEYKIEAINDEKETPSADNSSWKMRNQFGPVQTMTYDTDSEYKIEAINDEKETPSADNSSWKMRNQFGPVQTSFIPEHGMDVVLDLVADKCDEKKRFKFTVKNQLRKPFFNNIVTMEIEDEKSPLIDYMKKAVDEKNGLMKTFTVTYDTDSEYKIEAINDVKQTPSADNSSWKMRTELGPIETGTRICSFIPENGMNVILELNGPDDN